MAGKGKGLFGRLKTISALQNEQKSSSASILMNTLESKTLLQDTRNVLENKSDRILQALEEEGKGVLRKEGMKPPSKVREMLDRAGDTTLLKAYAVSMAYLGIGVCLWKWAKDQPEIRKKIDLAEQKWQELAPEREKVWKHFTDHSQE